MTTVTIDTFSNSASIFIRDILRQNLTDPQTPDRSGSDWIFKGQPEKKLISFPYVVLDCGRDLDILTANASKKMITNFKVNVEVWANDMGDRDSVADEIIKILRTPTSADSSGATLRSKSFWFKNVTDDDEDTFKTETQIIRLKRMTINFGYGGI